MEQIDSGLLDAFRPDGAAVPIEIQKAVFVARRIQQRAAELQTPSERRQQLELDRMLQTPGDKVTLIQMTDQAFRSREAHRTAEQFIHILDVQGVPRFFSPLDRTLLKGFQSFGAYAPGVAVPLVKNHMRKETANVILPAERELLAEHLQSRRAEGLRMNVNFLGEALLGEHEAERRLESYLESLQWPEIEVISVKISTLFSQISSIAREETLETLADRLEILFRTAAHLRAGRAGGSPVPKFVYLDMEEYRDMSLTAEAFMRVLDRPGLEQAAAGIALQAYIPDSFQVQQRLNEWARGRRSRGGSPITIRIVKGANMEMERLEASIRGWPQAPYKTKIETDANYKRMILEGMKPENIDAVRLGIASHNIFDLSFALVLAAERGLTGQVQFEMLEGMANHQRRALFEIARQLLLYAPACRKDQFLNAIGYLIRRLDENTGPENFLRHAFRLQVGSDDWNQLESAFVRSCEKIQEVSSEPRRNQNRALETGVLPRPEMPWNRFENEPDTDFSLAHHAAWARAIVRDWEPVHGTRAIQVPLVIDGAEIADAGTPRDCLDPSRPDLVVARYRQAGNAEIDRALVCARRDPDGWRSMTHAQRSEWIGRAAQEIRKNRARLIGAAVANAGKTIAEADPEVSEAVDFCEFYRSSARAFFELPGVHARPRGVVLVVSPWNFPIAIPCGGIAAALSAGNTVIVKPASDAVLVAWELCQCFWRAGISRRVLQFLPCSGGGPGRALAGDSRVDSVILTGGTSTALCMLRDQCEMSLFAETGGKNATIVTALSDHDQAIKHVLHSAFGHSGQKCSATSLLLLEDEVYHDPGFRQSFCDAVESLPVGSCWDLRTKIGPLIRPPSGDLENALKTLEPGESWAVLPRKIGSNPHLYSPGVKWGVQPGSYTHLTEFFGPVLGVMRFGKLAEAIALVNQTGYGLTSGLESLDDREQQLWRDGIRAGNLYINRPTTGAIVLRQPFGGMGKSCFGSGMKAGGPNYVAQFMSFDDAPPSRASIVEASSASVAGTSGGDDPQETLRARNLEGLRSALLQSGEKFPAAEVEKTIRAISSYEHWMHEEFGRSHDHFLLLGQDNFRRYLPVREMRIRVHPADSFFEILARVAAARAAGCRITLSLPENHESQAVAFLEEATEAWAAGIEFVEETDAALHTIVSARETDRIRFADRSRVPRSLRGVAAETGLYLADAPVLASGRVELLWYLNEQSLSIDYHRYGNLGGRSDEKRTEPQ